MGDRGPYLKDGTDVHRPPGRRFEGVGFETFAVCQAQIRGDPLGRNSLSVALEELRQDERHQVSELRRMVDELEGQVPAKTEGGISDHDDRSSLVGHPSEIVVADNLGFHVLPRLQIDPDPPRRRQEPQERASSRGWFDEAVRTEVHSKCVGDRSEDRHAVARDGRPRVEEIHLSDPVPGAHSHAAISPEHPLEVASVVGRYAALLDPATHRVGMEAEGVGDGVPRVGLSHLVEERGGRVR